MPRTATVLGGGTVALDPAAFEQRFNMPVVHEAVRAELAARRRGTASTRTRGQVSGGGSKPWRQKGTGRARQGSIRAPHFTGGGAAFGPAPRSYTVKVNRKARRAALRGALSLQAERGSLAVFDASVFAEPSTRRAWELLADWGGADPTLVLLDAAEATAGKSFRNIEAVEVMPVQDAGVADIVGAASLLVSQAALPALVRRAVASVREAAPEAPPAAASAPDAAPEAPPAAASAPDAPADEEAS
jgi:large subunit ribosomal protein L4